ncbi:MAG: helix-turn-helix domain-containing protein [Gammaproteobacteria bacterium]|jgi:transcriptional regulator with XRE-family HTH domain|nr:helix-turn-helix domain-containing protein [Gammaproteobacteria bacterium]
MNYDSMSDKAIGKALGERLKAWRLRLNLTQQQLAEAAALSLNVIKSLEAGKGKLSSVIAVLREFRLLEDLDAFIREPGISPLQLVKRQGKVRQRATGSRGKDSDKDADEW